MAWLKRILDYRRGNITRAERLYKELQRQALGLPGEATKKERVQQGKSAG